MKKILIMLLVFILVVIAAVGSNLTQYIPELPSRFARYHNTGSISVIVDGKEVDLEGIPLTYIYETGDIIESINLVDSEFKFKKGMYGPNTFRLKVPNELLGEVIIEFGQFNTNWWHVCNYNIYIELTSNSNGTVTADMIKAITVEKSEKISEISKILSKNDNTISDE